MFFVTLHGGFVLFGFEGNNTLDGGAGSDILVGGTGNDTYIFNMGYGQDTIYDYSTYDSAENVLNVVKFGPGLLASNAVVSVVGADLIIGFSQH